MEMRPTIPASKNAPDVTYLPSLIRSCRGLQIGKNDREWLLGSAVC